MGTATTIYTGKRTIDGLFDGFSTHRAVITIEIRERSGKEWKTIDHQTVDRYTELSMTGEITEKTRYIDGRSAYLRQPWTYGQNDDTIRAMLDPTREDAVKLLDIWEQWHLNGMRAACCHQNNHRPTADELAAWWKPQAIASHKATDNYFIRRSADSAIRDVFTAGESAKCPEGYQWGSAWLVAPLPDDVIEFLTTN